MNELKAFAAHCPRVSPLSSHERDELWARITGDATVNPDQAASSYVDVKVAPDAVSPNGHGPRRRSVAIAAAAVMLLGAAGIAVALRERSDTSPSNRPILSQPPEASATSTRPAVGWPPRLHLDGWTLRSYTQSSPDKGDFEYASKDHEADTEPSVVNVTADDGEVLASDVTQPNGVIQGMWTADDRAADWADQSARGEGPVEEEANTVVGYPARVFRIDSDRYAVVVAAPDGSIELRIPAAERSQLDQVLAGVRAVSADEFDSTLPETIVTPQQRSAAVEAMLVGVALPDAVDLSDIVSQPVYSDRDVLAVFVARRVACGWIDNWLDAVEAGNQTAVETAVAALESSRDWPVLAVQGANIAAYSETLRAIVDTLRQGGSVMTASGPAPITRQLAADALVCN